ncbi:DUF262 domain-containing protein [Dietzia sp.]|uniref:DUF262 domain-containing protein n=1 Tax=Dietzia sp. TaxID=1871616 RepID=UPI002FD8F517
MSTPPEDLTVRALFEDSSYVIPVYQRAYAWGEEQIEQLLRDVRDARIKGVPNYYLGTIVVHSDTRIIDGAPVERLEVVDGQQRLTTLALILSHPVCRELLGDAVVPATTITFEGRQRSQSDLAALAQYPNDLYTLESPARTLATDEIANGIQVITRCIVAANGEAVFVEKNDLEYLIDSVVVVRASLPGDTDLNHYFEIMNSRGEQLSKHEIVKARLLNKLEESHNERSTLTALWDACSDMTRYLQMGFLSNNRSDIFGVNWDRIEVDSWDELVADCGQVTPAESVGTTLGGVLDAECSVVEDGQEKDLDRYESIIDFPNLLLHALRLDVSLRIEKNPSSPTFDWADSDRPFGLDDKRLIDLFDEYVRTAEDVRGFMWTLFIVRFLFDNYVIKTDQNKNVSENDSLWVLHRPHRTGSRGSYKLSPRNTFPGGSLRDGDELPERVHDRIIHIQSMFQVTDSRRTYKNFLYAFLEILWFKHVKGDVDGERYLDSLNALASRRSEYLWPQIGETEGPEAVDRGVGVPHFLFNYLDYLLWNRLDSGDSALAELTDGVVVDERLIDAGSFAFRYRTSIEHFEPQNPDTAAGHVRLPSEVLDSFGNLAIMSRSENSKRNNLSAAAKEKQYRSDRESLKFQIMAAITHSRTMWGEAEIDDHGRLMREVLRSSAQERHRVWRDLN